VPILAGEIVSTAVCPRQRCFRLAREVDMRTARRRQNSSWWLPYLPAGTIALVVGIAVRDLLGVSHWAGNCIVCALFLLLVMGGNVMLYHHNRAELDRTRSNLTEPDRSRNRRGS